MNSPVPSDCSIYALKAGDDKYPESVLFQSLQSGEGRYGWGYVETADLRQLRRRIENDGWDNLTEDEQDCYSASFLLDLRQGDWVVYINMPEWGQCAAAQVTGEYFWRFDSHDFNHRFPVDPASVFTFDRNDASVHPALSARLKLQGRFWRIYTRDEFGSLVRARDTGLIGSTRTPATNLGFLAQEIRPLLLDITRKIQHTHPNYALEELFAATLQTVPGVREVRKQGGAGDHGADILVTFESGLPFTSLQQQRTCVVQVKSFVGDHGDLQAVDDIKRAFEYYPEAEMGLIVSTADRSTEELDDALDKLREETGKPVALLIGHEVAAFFLRFGARFIS